MIHHLPLPSVSPSLRHEPSSCCCSILTPPTALAYSRSLMRPMCTNSLQPVASQMASTGNTTRATPWNLLTIVLFVMNSRTNVSGIQGPGLVGTRNPLDDSPSIREYGQLPAIH